MNRKITLPYDSCPVAEFDLDGRTYAIKLNMAAIKRAEDLLAGRVDVTGHERDGVRVYEAHCEAVGQDQAICSREEFLVAWWGMTHQQAQALAAGVAAVYSPPAQDHLSDPPQAPPAQ